MREDVAPDGQKLGGSDAGDRRLGRPPSAFSLPAHEQLTACLERICSSSLNELKITVNKTILCPQGGRILFRLLPYDYLCPDQYSQLKTSFYHMLRSNGHTEGTDRSNAAVLKNENEKLKI